MVCTYNIWMCTYIINYIWVENRSAVSFRKISQISKPKSSYNWNKLRYINIFVLRLRTMWKHFYILNCVLFPMSYFLMLEHICGKSCDEMLFFSNFRILDIWEMRREPSTQQTPYTTDKSYQTCGDCSLYPTKHRVLLVFDHSTSRHLRWVPTPGYF